MERVGASKQKAVWGVSSTGSNAETMADTILVIDDSVTVRTAVRWVAESAGHHVVEAASLQEARAMLSNEQPDTILLDYKLPDGSGIDFCGELRQNPSLVARRILIMHGDAHPFDPEDARAARASGALRKPFRSQTLLDLLDQRTQDVTVETSSVPATPPAAPPPPSDDRDTIFAEADIVEEASPAPPAPVPSRAPAARTRSGAFRTPPMPGSGLHRLPPPGGQPVTIAGRGTMPRSPSGAFRAVDAEVPDTEETAPQETLAQETQDAASQQSPVQPRAHDLPPQTQQPTGRNEPTAEVNVLDDKDLEEETTQQEEAPATAASSDDAQLRAQIERIVSEVIEERLQAIVEEELPNIARRALAGLLRTELNEQIVRLGVTRRVQQFLDTDLPNYAQRAVDQRLDRNENS